MGTDPGIVLLVIWWASIMILVRVNIIHANNLFEVVGIVLILQTSPEVLSM